MSMNRVGHIIWFIRVKNLERVNYLFMNVKLLQTSDEGNS